MLGMLLQLTKLPDIIFGTACECHFGDGNMVMHGEVMMYGAAW